MDTIPNRSVDASDADFLMELDADREDLAPVRNAAEAGDMEAARRAFVEHMRTRSTPNWLYDYRDGSRGITAGPWPVPATRDTSASVARARRIVENHFVLPNGIVLDFAPGLTNWVDERTENHGVPGNAFRCCAWMYDLAVAWASTGDAAFSTKFAEVARRWTEDWRLEVAEDYDPQSIVFFPPRGFKTMPTGQRLLAWTACVYGGILFAPEVPTDTSFAFLREMWFSALQYLRFADCPFQGHNHHVMRCGNVPGVMGLFFPEFPVLRPLVDIARKTLTAHTEQSFLADGGYKERSTSYSMATMHMFLNPLRIARRNGVELLDAEHAKALERCVDGLCKLILPHGAPQPVGDGSPGAAAVVSFLDAALDATDSPAARAVPKLLGLDAKLPPQTAEQLAADDPTPPPPVTHLPVSGYFAARSAWSPTANAMGLVCPNGDADNTGHSHDDSLSLQLVVGGVSLVGHPTSELYVHVNDPKYRNTEYRGYSYSMEAQNVVLVSGRPPRTPEDLVSGWNAPLVAVDCEWEETDGGVRISASHEGYEGARLSREIVFDFASGWTVRDGVEGDADGPHLQRWHFEYGVEVEKTDDGFLASRNGAALAVSVDGADDAILYCNEKWMEPNAHTRDDPDPWVLDVRFGGGGANTVTTTFRIVDAG